MQVVLLPSAPAGDATGGAAMVLLLVLLVTVAEGWLGVGRASCGECVYGGEGGRREEALAAGLIHDDDDS